MAFCLFSFLHIFNKLNIIYVNFSRYLRSQKFNNYIKNVVINILYYETRKLVINIMKFIQRVKYIIINSNNFIEMKFFGNHFVASYRVSSKTCFYKYNENIFCELLKVKLIGSSC